ncbi:GIY-YIG nuclease family protein [Sphingomonas sp. CFBP 8760]|uniref:GIY-YIG nuclease family protein n=1 Tax=Sphingomonas sp. CFBP 8760 TaxID=2775282 RepID=UPI00177D18FF|nr:GIY-YIG nuclease family protein [Sphingomonas sp. CFBP 8760]MBD8546034.1 GIY-YIG nuclease family protein [Sphingomonas sp. CFBP 8760]
MGRSIDLFYDTLDELIANKDDLFVPVVKPARTAGDDVTRLFLDIVAFRERTGRSPDGKARAPDEMRLGVRLDSFRRDAQKVERLKHIDQYGLLEAPRTQSFSEVVPASIDDLIAAGDDLLSTPEDHIFEFRATPAPPPKSETDSIAERIRCKDFDLFQPIFDACVADIANGARNTVPTSSTYQIEVGDMFVIGGALAYIADVDRHTRNDRGDARLRIIYDNGSESDHLLRSFGKALYRAENSRRVFKPDAGPLFEGGKPSVTGRVYVAKTLSTNPALVELAEHILKIGSTTESAASRVAGASADPTFLLAEAKIMDEYETRGVPPKKIEGLLHRFFGAACVDVQLPDRFGRSVDPREWFMVSRSSVEEAMRLIATKALHLYRYDTAADQIIRK